MSFMKNFTSVLIVLFIGLTSTAYAQTTAKFEQTKNGVIIYPDSMLSGNAKAVRLEVITDKIIRVTASPNKTFPSKKSLVTVYNSYSNKWTLTKSPSKIIIKTPAVTATVALSTGAVAFTDNAGKSIVAEKSYGGRSIMPAVFEGQRSYAVKQAFQTTADDSYYGLGQHQDDQFNYKGQQVYMFQNNTEVAVPFLVSSKNYGILWDNYSISKVGDTRDYMPLSTLKLYSAQGDEGWLTTTYSNDRNKPEDVMFLRAESEINYPFLNDTKNGLPVPFKPQTGVVTWKGAIESAFTGKHNFKFTYAGYTKVWVNGKMLLDRWRQAWNPGSAVMGVDMEANKKYDIKIEWIPDGSESYLTCKWINPSDEPNTFGFASEAGQQLDYYLVKGNSMDDVISGYRTLTGKATIVPKWAMGFWQSRERYKTQAELLSAVEEFRKRKIPLDNIVLDWSYWKQNEWGRQTFDPARFPDPDSMIAVLHNKYKTQIMISVWPKFYTGIPEYNDFNGKGWVYKRNVADSQRDWIAQGYVGTFYDAFNVNARRGFWNLINQRLYSKGIDAWWMDASEPDILTNASPEKRKAQMMGMSAGIAAENLNAYPLENAKGIFEGQRSVDPEKRVFLLTRSGFAGSQHYAANIWSGDIASRWEDMKAQISAGLNFSMSGIPFWTMDIGGFSVERRYEKPSEANLEEWRELQARWFQFGSFVPLFRAHGQFPFREVYNIAPEDHPAYQSMLYYNKLRYRLMPYIYTLAGMTYHNDYTIMRGLVMDFAKDVEVKNIGDQFMFGPSLLINPIYTYKEKTKQLYLPAGQGWYDLYTGKYMNGGQHLQVNTTYDKTPVYVKEGSIIPFGPALQYTAEKPADTITLHVYTGKNAAFTLYEDENTNYGYEKGAFSNIPLTYDETQQQLTVGTRTGSFNGMLMNRKFKIVWIDKNNPVMLEFDKEGKVYNYSGQAIKVSKPK